jgi:hypothetical protein
MKVLRYSGTLHRFRHRHIISPVFILHLLGCNDVQLSKFHSVSLGVSEIIHLKSRIFYP